MNKKRPDDIKFLFNTAGFTLMVVAVLVAFQPYLENEPKLEDVKRVEAKITDMTPQEMVARIAAKKDRPMLLVGYASWCYFCRQVMPMIVDTIKNHEIDGIDPLFISLDDQPRKLSKYLVYSGYDPVVVPYMLDRNYFKKLPPVTDITGSHFNGIIPYIGFFNKDGKMVSEVVGVVSKNKFMEMSKKVTQ